MIIEETKKTSELKQVEETTTVERIKCDVCGHTYNHEDWCGNEFAVNPGIDREFHSIRELSEFFDAYYTDIPTHVVDDGYKGYEMEFTADSTNFIEALAEESQISLEIHEKNDATRRAINGLKEQYADKIAVRNFYLTDNTIHYFAYRLNIEESADEYKHVCYDCYNVIFDGS